MSDWRFTKLKKLLFYLILFLIPCNLAKHLPQPWSYVNGILVDYLIPTLYLTDILIIILLILWLADTLNLKLKSQMSNLHLKTKNLFRFTDLSFGFEFCVLSFAFLLLLFSSLKAVNFYAAIYKLIKLIEFSFLIIYIKNNINIKKDIKNVLRVLSFSLIWQSSLAICQWFKQGSIFGYWFFGEQPYNSTTLGIKMIDFFGKLKIPPYGTFPHPNILAGFLSLSLIFILSFLASDRVSVRIISREKIVSLTPNLSLNLILNLSTFILGTIALFLTFSIFSWLIFFLLLFLFIKNLISKTYHRRLKKLYLISYWVTGLLTLLIIGLLSKNFLAQESLSRRIKLAEIAIKMFLSSPLFGVGLNNFIVRMEEFGQVIAPSRFLQPVHNIYLLILAETGIIGLLAFGFGLWILVKNLWKKKKENYFLFLTFSSIFLLGFFDHYFLTIQQGLLLSSLFWGIIINNLNHQKSIFE